MSQQPSQTVLIRSCIERLRQGDDSARSELLNLTCDRLMRITRKIKRDFPQIQRWEQTDDVFQNASMRLCRALERIELTDSQHFFRLAEKATRLRGEQKV